MTERRKTTLWQLLGFACLPVAALWVSVEIVLSICWLPSPQAGVPPAFAVVVKPHPYRVYAYKSGRTEKAGDGVYNSVGFRDREFAEQKPPHTIRIICLGGSTTYSLGATSNSVTYPAYLQRFLRQRYAGAPFDIEVINAGHPVYSSLEPLILFQTRVLDFSPDVAILMTGVNDLWEALKYATFSSDYSHSRHTLGPLRPAVWEHSRLLSLLLARATSPFNPYRPNPDRNLVHLTHQPWYDTAPSHTLTIPLREAKCAETVGRNALSFVAVARGNNVIPVIATETFGPQYEVFAEALERSNETLRTIASSQSVVLVDVARAMPWNAEQYFDAVHLRDGSETYGRMGKLFADALAKAGVIEQAARNLNRGASVH